MLLIVHFQTIRPRKTSYAKVNYGSDQVALHYFLANGFLPNIAHRVFQHELQLHTWCIGPGELNFLQNVHNFLYLCLSVILGSCGFDDFSLGFKRQRLMTSGGGLLLWSIVTDYTRCSLIDGESFCLGGCFTSSLVGSDAEGDDGCACRMLLFLDDGVEFFK